MNTRQMLFVLGALIACLLLFNTLIIGLLLRQRSEIETLRAQLAARQTESPLRPRNSKVASLSDAPAGSSLATQTLSITLGGTNEEHGLEQVYDAKDGATMPAGIDGVACRELTGSGGRQKIYFKVAPAFKLSAPANFRVQVEYFDAATSGTLTIEYVGPSSYTGAEPAVALKHSSNWHTVNFDLKAAQFTGRQNDGGDFRVVATARKVFVRRVTLKKE